MDLIHLDINSRKAFPEIESGEYNLGIFVSSFESRASRITIYKNMTFDNAVLIRFVEEESRPQRINNDRILESFIKENSRKYEVLRCKVTSWTSTVQSMLQIVGKLLAPNDSNAIFIDITTFPKFYFCSLLTQFFFLGYGRRYDFFYAEGEYVWPSRTSRKLFTRSEWVLCPVPGLEGQLDPSKERGFLVSAGWESPKVKRVLCKYFPNQISFLEANPGFNPSYTEESKKAVKDILKYVSVAGKEYLNRQKMEAPAGNTESAYDVLIDGLRNDIWGDDDKNWTLLPCGPKPHALAMALVALCVPAYCLVYPTTRGYVVHDAIPTGIDWIHQVIDPSV
jgi:hypothetical protein